MLSPMGGGHPATVPGHTDESQALPLTLWSNICPWAELSVGPIVQGPRCPRAQLSRTKCPGKKCPGAEVSEQYAHEPVSVFVF